MKKITILPVLFALIFVASCTRTDESIDLVKKVVTSIEAHIDADGTRTTATVENDGSIQMLWRAGDKIVVTDLTTSAQFELKDGAKSSHGVFNGSIATVSDNLYAVYPAEAATISGADAKITIPQQQLYAEGKDIDMASRNVMVGMTSNASSFDFYTVASIARFNVKVDDEEIITSITMRVEDGYLSGTGSVIWDSAAIDKLNIRNMTLTLAEPKKGEVKGAWALVAPIDYTSTTGRVFYDVVTNKGKYTFCRKPNKAFRPGYVYTFPIDKSKFEQVSSTSALADGKYYFASTTSTLVASLIRATDTTIAFAWSPNGFPADYSAELSDTYKLTLYDANNNLLVSWLPNQDQVVTGTLFSYSESNPTYPHRFIFTGLTPSTTYKIQVQNMTTNKKSSMLTVQTAPYDCAEVVGAASKEGDVVLYENFGKLVWNGDITTLAAGYVYKNYTSITDIADGTAWGDYSSTDQTVYQYTNREREQQFFSTYKSIVESTGLGEWAYWRNTADDSVTSTSTAILARPGYLKIGITKVRAGIVTPELTPLQGKATIRVTFKATSYGTLSTDLLPIGVSVVDNCTVSNYKLTKSTYVDGKTFNLEDDLGWHTYSVELKNATPTSRILIYAAASDVSSKNNRFHVDDIKVELVNYNSAVNLPVVKQVASTAHSATIEWTESEQATRKYNVALYNDRACTSLYQQYDTTLASSSYVGQWPARFTFTYLNPNTTYYAKVTNAAGTASIAVPVKTGKPYESQQYEVLHQDFDYLCWGGDYINMANSVLLTATASSYSPNALSDAISSSKTTSSPSTDASKLSAYTAKVRELFGLSEWESDAAYVRPGFIKLGTAAAPGYLNTPQLINMTSDNATITVSFKACPFVDNATDQTDFIYVNVLDGNGDVKYSTPVTISGRRNQPGWEEYSVEFTSVARTDRVQFKCGASTQSRFCLDDVHISSLSAVAGNYTYGYVRYADGTPAAGVSVSDGFTVAVTNDFGYYMLFVNKDAWYIFYSIPEDCAVQTDSYGLPLFYEKYSSTKKKYDFTLTKLAGGVENSFNLFCFADPQCQGTTHVNRFNNETVPDVKAQVASLSTPSYGVTLGDVVFSTGATNTEWVMPSMRTAMNKSKIGLPVFQTMGNHDYTYFYGSSNPNKSDETSSTPDIRAQRKFESIFGPINYSWNRGNVHIVSMRDIIYKSTTDASNYELGFTDAQYKWLQQDLAAVPKTKMVILCVHIPIVNSKNQNVQNVISLLKQFKEGHIMSGHTHYMRNEPTKSGGVYEHVHAAVCGGWWNSNINGDGCPNGYSVYRIEGNTMVDWYYKGFNANMKDRSYQIRLYRANLVGGGSYEYFKRDGASNVLLANVFNSDTDWTIKVYENGVYSGDMTLIPNKKYNDDSSSANYLPRATPVGKSNPTVVPDDSSQDWWAIGYHVGVLNRSRNSYFTTCYHMYKYTLKNASASIKVVATDKFGNEYTQTKVMNDYEYTLAIKP